jgi:hypothetical protein
MTLAQAVHNQHGVNQECSLSNNINIAQIYMHAVAEVTEGNPGKAAWTNLMRVPNQINIKSRNAKDCFPFGLVQ